MIPTVRMIGKKKIIMRRNKNTLKKHMFRLGQNRITVIIDIKQITVVLGGNYFIIHN